MAVLLVGPLASAAQASVGFSAPASYAPGVSTAQRDFAVGDFNGDGNVDAAITGGATGDISFLMGDGHGGFGTPVPVTSGSSYLAVASGDFNNDGKLDLVGVDHSSPDSVRVFTGDGAGGFTAQTPVTVGHRDLTLAVADFNRDGKLDVAVADCGAHCTGGSGSPAVAILLGDGNGGFGSPTTLPGFPGGAVPNTVSVGDFNGDGNPDLAVLDENGGNVLPYLGDGHGGFSAGTTLVLGGSGQQGLAVGDLNGDGKQDLAISASTNNVSVALGNGSGGFATPVNYPLPTLGYGIAIRDLNGDGIPDLAVADFSGVSVLLGNGNGTFQSHMDFPAGQSPVGVASSDLNGDSQPDVVVTNNAGSNGLTVLLNTAAAGLGFSPSPLDFGSVVTGTSAPQKVERITNTGSGVLKVGSVALLGTNPGDYSLVSDGCSGQTVLVGSSCQIAVGFRPGAIGARSATLSVVTNAPGSPQGLSLTGTGLAPPVPPVTIAIISKLTETNSVFAVAGGSTPVRGTTAKHRRPLVRHKRGTVFSFRLDQRATITVKIQHRLAGRRVGRLCKPDLRRLRHRSKCTRLVTKATLIRAAHAGLNRIRFSGRIRGHALKPGLYQAVFRATDAAGTSRPSTLRFRIVKR